MGSRRTVAAVFGLVFLAGWMWVPHTAEPWEDERSAGAISLREVCRFDDETLWLHRIVGVEDLDGDGLKDVILADWYGIHVVYAMASEMRRAEFTPFETGEDVVRSGPGEFSLMVSDAVLEDLDSDGDLDLVVSGADLGTSGADRFLYLFENRLGTLHLHTKQATPWYVTRLDYGERDGVPGFRGLWEPSVVERLRHVASIWIPLAAPFAPGEIEQLFAFPPATWVKCAADVNGDGWEDYGMRVEEEERFEIWHSEAGGVYKLGPTFDSEGWIWRAEFGDLNHDGRMDVVVGNTNQVMAFSMDSDALVPLGGPIATGAKLEAMGLCDLDRDGRLDLLLSPYGQTILWYPGDGQGGFDPLSTEFIPSQQVMNMAGAGDWAFSDVDGDGSEDLLFTSLQATHLMLNSQTASGVNTLPLYGGEPLLVSDLDDDGESDLLVRTSSGFFVYRNQGGGRMAQEPWGSARRADCIAARIEDNVWMLHSTGAETSGLSRFNLEGELLEEVELGGIPQGVLETGDLDGDGFEDLIGSREDGVWIYWGDGELSEYPLDEQISIVHVADVDGDGLDDAVALRADDTYHADQLVFDGRLLVRDDLILETTGLPMAIDSADLDEDGTDDLAVLTVQFTQESGEDGTVIVRPGTVEIVLLLSDGNQSVVPLPTFPEGEIPYPGDGLVAGDFDGDGHIDLAVSSTNASALHILPGNGDGTFAEEHLGRPGIGPLLVGDLDGQEGTELLGMILGYPPAVWIQWNGGRR